MFSDVSEDNVHAGDINCIAAYGITVGMGDGTYAPDANVTAFEMGLFVQRAADLMGADGDAVLDDVELSDHVTRLEMALLMFGLVNDIDDDVRINPADGQIQSYNEDSETWDVVNDFFADAKAQVPIFESQVVGAAYELGITRGTKGDGTMVSTPGSTFEPFANVTRAQMASFIARTLDHSNLRPEGLSVQRNSNRNTMISLRDADFAPIEDARIDVFSALYADDAFDEDDGECEGRFVQDETGSFSLCQIDRNDRLTDDDGNVELTLSSDDDPITAACTVGTGDPLAFTTAAGSAGRTVWAWTGDLGDEFDEDTVRQELESVARPVGSAGPNYARITGGLPTGDELAKMGETVTFTLQLYSLAGSAPNADKDTAVGPDRSRNPYHLRVEKYFVARVAGTDSDAGDADPTARTGSASAAGQLQAAPGDWNYVAADGTTVQTADAARPFNTPVDTVVWPNGDGEYNITLTNPDLNAAMNSTDVGVKFTLTPFIAANDLISANLVDEIEAKGNFVTHADDVVAAGGVDVASGHVIFSDDASDPHAVSGETAQYRIISGSASGNSVTVSVVDQYGDGMRNVQISVSSGLDTAATADDEVTYPEEVDITIQSGENNADGTSSDSDTVGTFGTRRNGTYRIGYTYTGDEAQTEAITPQSVAVTGDNPATEDTVETDFVLRAQELGSAVNVHWTKVGNNAASSNSAGVPVDSVQILVSDVASRTIVVDDGADDGDNPSAYFYDEDDTFIVAGVGATFEMFEEALSATYKDNGIYAARVEWDNYVTHRPGRVNRTIWDLTLSCTEPS